MSHHASEAAEYLAPWLKIGEMKSMASADIGCPHSLCLQHQLPPIKKTVLGFPEGHPFFESGPTSDVGPRGMPKSVTNQFSQKIQLPKVKASQNKKWHFWFPQTSSLFVSKGGTKIHVFSPGKCPITLAPTPHAGSWAWAGSSAAAWWTSWPETSRTWRNMAPRRPFLVEQTSPFFGKKSLLKNGWGDENSRFEKPIFFHSFRCFFLCSSKLGSKKWWCYLKTTTASRDVEISASGAADVQLGFWWVLGWLKTIPKQDEFFVFFFHKLWLNKTIFNWNPNPYGK